MERSSQCDIMLLSWNYDEKGLNCKPINTSDLTPNIIPEISPESHTHKSKLFKEKESILNLTFVWVQRIQSLSSEMPNLKLCICHKMIFFIYLTFWFPFLLSFIRGSLLKINMQEFHWNHKKNITSLSQAAIKMLDLTLLLNLCIVIYWYTPRLIYIYTKDKTCHRRQPSPLIVN